MIEPYDKEDVYDTEIHPLLEQIQTICQRHDLNFLALTQYGYDGQTHGMAQFIIPQQSVHTPEDTFAVGELYIACKTLIQLREHPQPDVALPALIRLIANISGAEYTVEEFTLQ